MTIPPLTRGAGELCLDCIRDAAQNSVPTVRFESTKSGMMLATFTATINGQRKSTTIEFRGDDWNVDEGEWQAQVFWFAANKKLGLNAPDGIPKSLRPRRKGSPAPSPKSNKPAMGFWR
jgi:hypothetical protein